MPSSGDDSAHCATAAILVSRQSLRPCRANLWVQSVVAAVEWIKHHHMTLVTTVGRPTWDLITSCGSIHGVNMRVWYELTDSGSPEDILSLQKQFGLTSLSVSFVPTAPDGGSSEDEQNHLIDRAICAQADLLIPISIRPGGFMDRALSEAEGRDTPILWNFYCGPPESPPRISYDLRGLTINPELDQVAGEYIVHWTRGSNHPWPDELPIDFYRSILTSERYPRAAFDTLHHILSTGTIQSSSNHMPDSTPTVSFSELSPREVIPLMRWRARYSQMSFEPYGIGIKKELARHLGVLPVSYYDHAEKTLPEAVPAWLTQSAGKVSDWRAEKEYRHLGSFELNQAPSNALIAFCLTPQESAMIAGQFRMRTIPFRRD
ncbi:MAG: hypothetical protein WAU88_02880 [Candidatus Zixiibacteriota bacterium]